MLTGRGEKIGGKGPWLWILVSKFVLEFVLKLRCCWPASDREGNQVLRMNATCSRSITQGKKPESARRKAKKGVHYGEKLDTMLSSTRRVSASTIWGRENEGVIEGPREYLGFEITLQGKKKYMGWDIGQNGFGIPTEEVGGLW